MIKSSIQTPKITWKTAAFVNWSFLWRYILLLLVCFLVFRTLMELLDSDWVFYTFIAPTPKCPTLACSVTRLHSGVRLFASIWFVVVLLTTPLVPAMKWTISAHKVSLFMPHNLTWKQAAFFSFGFLWRIFPFVYLTNHLIFTIIYAQSVIMPSQPHPLINRTEAHYLSILLWASFIATTFPVMKWTLTSHCKKLVHSEALISPKQNPSQPST